jgi:hypothetical protein
LENWHFVRPEEGTLAPKHVADVTLILRSLRLTFGWCNERCHRHGMDNFRIKLSVNEDQLGRLEDFVKLLRTDFRSTYTQKSDPTSQTTKYISAIKTNQFMVAYRNALRLFCES